MRRRDRESIRDIDPHDGLFFGSSDDDADLYGEHDVHARDEHVDDADHDDRRRDPDPADDRPDEGDDGRRPRPGPRAANGHGVTGSRLEKRRRSRNRRRKRALGVLAFLVVVLLGISVWFIGLPVYHYFFPKDYDGSGSGSVIVTIRANEGSGEIGTTLEKAGVVGSQRAFTDAASDNDRARDIQPGSYKLRKHMAATQALALLLKPSSRIDSDTVVTEGATVVDVQKRLVAPPCSSAASGSGACGLGLSKAAVTKALTNVKALGLPTDYLRAGRTPPSVEGFLFPATYTFDDETSVTEALQQMVGKFTDQARSTKFSARAKAVHLTPYQALTIASIAQAEAKFPEDFAKVARVIMNRLAAHKPLQIDATSAYAAKLRGVDPTEEIYAETKGPFNTYTNAGLPPTPIGNPGEDAMTGAVTPAKGSWMYYVNRDAAGHLGFYSDEKSFTRAQQRCHDEGWGCAAP